MDRRHPRIELLVEPTRQEPDIGAADRHQRAVHGDALVARLLDDLLEGGGDRQDRLAGAGAAVEGDDGDVGVEQQFEREALLLVARPQSPRLGHGVRQQHQLVADPACERRLRSRAQHGELVLGERHARRRRRSLERRLTSTAPAA